MTQADRVYSTPPTNTPVDTTRRFETLKDAEDALMEQGFKLVPNTCNWIDADGNDAGTYPVEEAYGVLKYRIEYRRQVFPVGPTRRSFLARAAGVAAGGTALALATIQPMTAASEPVAVLPNDSALLKLEEQIFEQHEGATAYDDEIGRLHDIWTGELKRLAVEG
jgi:hypothetical protein